MNCTRNYERSFSNTRIYREAPLRILELLYQRARVHCTVLSETVARHMLLRFLRVRPTELVLYL
jgi:hypothetical protein